jgi:ERCC4-type nuclease
MSSQLVIDVRESRLITELTRLSIPHTTEALDVGDILFKGTEGNHQLVIERKSHADFAASNTDGRYREQRGRLLAVRGSGIAVLYILEGAFSHMDERPVGGGRVTEGLLKRLTSRLMLRYGLPMLFTESIADTASWCGLLLTQLNEDPTVFIPDSSAAATSAMTSFTAALTTAKKGSKTAGGTAAAMLSAVPGLGAKRVESLLATASIANLVALTVEQLAEVSAGGKRLGPKVAETLYAAFHSV